MSSSSPKHEEDICKELTSLLVSAGMLEQTQADIYTLALKQGKITTKDVHSEFQSIQQNHAITFLNKLAEKGFLESFSLETEKKHPSKKFFKPIHPKIALSKMLKDLPPILGKFEEYWDHLVEGTVQSSDIWQSESEKIGYNIGASTIAAARREIRIYAHDCTWLYKGDIEESIEKAKANNITVTVVVEKPSEKLAKKILDANMSLYTCDGNFGLPFCVVDDDWLFLPVMNGTVSQRFSALRTSNRYVIQHYQKLFDTILGYSVKWGKNNA